MRLLGAVSALALAGGAWLAGALPAGHRTGPPGPYTAGLVICLLGLAGLITAWLMITRSLLSTAPPAVAVSAAATRWAPVTGALSARGLLLTGVLWQLPFLFAPPLGSRDVYSYACQGWVFARSLDPYTVSPRAGECPWLPGVATLWQDATTPYGPFALLLSGGAAAGGSWILALTTLRLVALAGLVLAALGIHRLATALGLDPRRAAWIGLPAPLIALHAVSGAHHDALLAGLVLAALALSVGHPPPPARPAPADPGSSTAALSSAPAGLVVLAGAGAALGLAAAIKITALAALPFVLILAARAGLRRTLPVVAGVVGSFALVSVVSGLGLGWLAALTGSTGPKQWTSIPTGVGLAAGYLLRVAGLAAHEDLALAVARLAGLVALAVIALACAWTAWRRRADPHAVVLRAGIVLLALVVLGPVAYPWYFLTPLPVLAAALTTGRHLRRLAGGAAFVSVLVLPDGLGIPSLTKAPGAVVDLLVVITLATVAARRLAAHRRARRG